MVARGRMTAVHTSRSRGPASGRAELRSPAAAAVSHGLE